MNLAASFDAYCVSGLSCPTYSAVPTSDLYCGVSCSSRPSAPSRKPLPTVFEPSATATFHVCLLELLLAVETEPVSHCQCVFRIVRPGETFSVPCHFSVQEFHWCQKTRADAFTDFHLEYSSHAIRMLSLGSFSCRRFSSDNHIARQTPLITRFAFSILP